jgi:hypothetical protein
VCRPSPHLGTAVMLVAVEELQEQPPAQEGEMNSRKGAIIVWEVGLAPSEHTLGRACMESNIEHA